MTGFYLMRRGWMDNPALGSAREPYCRRAAWAWLVENACYQDGKASIAGNTVDLIRGQLTYSSRYLAKAWDWSEPAVRRFLDRLKKDGMILASSDAGQTVITICKYEQYQGFRDRADAPDGTTEQADIRPTQGPTSDRSKTDAPTDAAVDADHSGLSGCDSLEKEAERRSSDALPDAAADAKLTQERRK